MGGFSFRVELEDFDEAEMFLSRLSARQLRDIAQMAGVELISREALSSQEDPVDGSRWQPSRKKKSGGFIPRDTSRLMRSVKSRAEGSSVLVGSHLVYARIHQQGGRARRGGSANIPQRRYSGFKKSWPERFMSTPEVRRFFT